MAKKKEAPEIRFKVRRKSDGLFAHKNSQGGSGYGGVSWNKRGTIWNMKSHLMQAFKKGNSLGNVKPSTVEVVTIKSVIDNVQDAKDWLKAGIHVIRY